MSLAVIERADLIAENFSYQQAMRLKEEATWRQLQKVTVGQALDGWYATLSMLTRLNYRSAMSKLIEFGLLDESATLQALSLSNTDAIIDRIKQKADWSENTRQARAAAFISFTRFLSRRTGGMIKKAVPSKEGNTKTFYRVHEKVCTQAMTQSQWIKFFEALERINPRDCLIAKVILQGGKRVNEVLGLTSDHIDFANGQVTFSQSKTKGLVKETVITYPASIMEQLRQYIGGRKGLVFVTSSGGKVFISQLAGTFAKAGHRASIAFKVTPHVLRASAVTYLKAQGFQDSEIMKVTGHASSSMVNAYDKSERADNPTRKISLIN